MTTHHISAELAIILEESRVIETHGDIWDCESPSIGAFSIRFFENTAELFEHSMFKVGRIQEGNTRYRQSFRRRRESHLKSKVIKNE